jgi:hypothetical protein
VPAEQAAASACISSGSRERRSASARRSRKGLPGLDLPQRLLGPPPFRFVPHDLEQPSGGPAGSASGSRRGA